MQCKRKTMTEFVTDLENYVYPINFCRRIKIPTRDMCEICPMVLTGSTVVLFFDKDGQNPLFVLELQNPLFRKY